MIPHLGTTTIENTIESKVAFSVCNDKKMKMIIDAVTLRNITHLRLFFMSLDEAGGIQIESTIVRP